MKQNEDNNIVDDTKNGSILLNHNDKKINKHGRKSFNITKYDHKKITENFEGTEINSGIINDLKNVNNAISNYISDANYSCFPNNISPKQK